MKKFAVLGLGRFGQSLAIELCSMGNEVLTVDKFEENVIEVQDYVTHTLIADVADEDVIRELGLEQYDCVIIAIGNDIQDSILCAIICKDNNVQKLWAKASSELHAKALTKIGVDRVILPEKDMGTRVAHQIANNNIVDYIALSNDDEMAEISIRPEWEGKTLSQVNFRTKFGINIIGIKRGNEFIATPGADFVVEKGDILCVIGKNIDVEKL